MFIGQLRYRSRNKASNSNRCPQELSCQVCRRLTTIGFQRECGCTKRHKFGKPLLDRPKHQIVYTLSDWNSIDLFTQSSLAGNSKKDCLYRVYRGSDSGSQVIQHFNSFD